MIIAALHRPLELTLAFIQDLGRTLDYLESRGDIDTSRVAYMGLSRGAGWAPITMAYGNRFKVGVLIGGGIRDESGARTAPRVTAPVLLLGGRYDYLVPVETRQRPLIDLLGAPEQHKRHVTYEAGHLPLPRAEVIRETLAWLDRYQNPVVLLTQPAPTDELIDR